MTLFSSTGRRREIGAELREMREAHGHNGQAMARLMQWTATALSRAETGKRALSEREVATYTGLCRVTGERQQRIFDLLAESDTYRLKAHPGQIPDELRTFIFLESSAIAIEGFEPIYIPGILQTPAYARALFEEGGKFDADAIEPRVQIRVARRAVLTRVKPAWCTIYVHENALRSGIGGPKVMEEQLLQMIFTGGRPQCAIRVVPASAAGRGLTAGSFQIFRYAEDSPMVYVQNEITSEFIESDPILRAYEAVLARLATVALHEDQSRDFMVWLASEYEQRGVAEHDDRAGGMAEE